MRGSIDKIEPLVVNYTKIQECIRFELVPFILTKKQLTI